MLLDVFYTEERNFEDKRRADSICITPACLLLVLYRQPRDPHASRAHKTFRGIVSSIDRSGFNPHPSDQTPIAQRMISSRYLSLVFIVALSEHVKTAGQGRLSSVQVDYLEISQNIKSHTTRKAQKAHVPWNKSLAVLGRSLAFLSSLFPLPIFSVVKNESCTSCSMCSFCSVRLVTRVDCSSEISIRERSAVLYTQLVFCF